MPSDNRTGPGRAGRMTGRCRGPCGEGLGRRAGRHRNILLPDRAEEKEALEIVLRILDDNKTIIETRLKELE